MAIPNVARLDSNLEMPSYIIYRDTPLGQQFDPTAAPVFFPPKDSDELFDALRAKYPHLKTHSERMRDAMIEFLIEERQSSQAEQVPMTTADLSEPILPTDTTDDSPWQQSWPSMSAGSASLFSSPDTLDLATPNFGMSPQPQYPRLDRQPSTVSSFTTSPDLSNSVSPTAGSSTPALENMTGVFSVSASAQPKQRLRRKMTDAEKADYRKRRIVKACDKCAKRKRKCIHNQPEMEQLVTKQKVTKPRQQSQKITAEPSIMRFDSFEFDESLFDTDMQLFDDFTTLDEEPEYNFDKTWERAALGMTAYTGRGSSFTDHKSDDLGFDTAMDSWSQDDLTMGKAVGRNAKQAISTNTNATHHGTQNVDVAAGHKKGWQPNDLFSTTNTRRGPAELAAAQANGSHNDLLWEHVRTGQNSTRLHDLFRQADTRRGDVPMLRTSPSVRPCDPTHTLHAHDEVGNDRYLLDEASKSADIECGRTTSPRLPETVTRMTGTAKAGKAFGATCRTHQTRSPPQSSSPEKAIVAIGLRASQLTQQHDSARNDGMLLSEATLGHLETTHVHNNASVSAHAGAPQSWGSSSNMRNHLDQLDANAHAHPGVQSLPEGTNIKKWLKRHTVTQTSSTERSDYQPVTTAATTTPLSQRTLSLPSVSVSISSLQPQIEAANPEEGTHHPTPTPTLTPGEGIDRIPSPSVEMFRLKRRIPKALHSVVDRNNRRVVRDLDQQDDQAVPQIATQANGGAYPRLATDVHATSSGSQQQQVAVALAEDRLPDHVRRRDHFGRTSILADKAGEVLAGEIRPDEPAASRVHATNYGTKQENWPLLAIGALLLSIFLGRMVLAVAVQPTILLLAAVSIWPTTTTTADRNPIARCSGKNSSWLGLLVDSSLLKTCRAGCWRVGAVVGV